jgi:hypothetical protein
MKRENRYCRQTEHINKIIVADILSSRRLYNWLGRVIDRMSNTIMTVTAYTSRAAIGYR